MLFNKQVSEDRIYEVKQKWSELRGDWMPRQTNGYELYKEAGSWDKIDISKFKTIDWEDSWKDIPEKLLNYIESLPEFDSEIFKEITGIDTTKPEEMIDIDGKQWSKETIKEALKQHAE